MIRCSGCGELVEPGRYGWTLQARGEHIETPTECRGGGGHQPEDTTEAHG